MFHSLESWIRGLPLWAKVIAWPLYGLLRAVVWAVDMLGQIILHAGQSFFGYVAHGSLIAVLVKVAGAILLAGLAAIGLGMEQIGSGLVWLAAAPIMVVGLIIMVQSVLPSAKKKKKKAH